MNQNRKVYTTSTNDKATLAVARILAAPRIKTEREQAARDKANGICRIKDCEVC